MPKKTEKHSPFFSHSIPNNQIQKKFNKKYKHTTVANLSGSSGATSTSINNEKNRNNKEGITRVKLLSNLKIKWFLNKICPIPYQGFKKDHMLPNII